MLVDGALYHVHARTAQGRRVFEDEDEVEGRGQIEQHLNASLAIHENREINLIPCNRR